MSYAGLGIGTLICTGNKIYVDLDIWLLNSTGLVICCEQTLESFKSKYWQVLFRYEICAEQITHDQESRHRVKRVFVTARQRSN